MQAAAAPAAASAPGGLSVAVDKMEVDGAREQEQERARAQGEQSPWKRKIDMVARASPPSAPRPSLRWRRRTTRASSVGKPAPRAPFAQTWGTRQRRVRQQGVGEELPPGVPGITHVPSQVKSFTQLREEIAQEDPAAPAPGAGGGDAPAPSIYDAVEIQIDGAYRPAPLPAHQLLLAPAHHHSLARLCSEAS